MTRVAGTITWEQLRELAAFRATRGCAVSLYLDLDPSVAPTAGDVQVRVSSLLGEAERRLESGRARFNHECRAALRGDIEHARIDRGKEALAGATFFATE